MIRRESHSTFSLCFLLEARDYEDAIRNAVSIGSNSDTIACITGGIAEDLSTKFQQI